MRWEGRSSPAGEGGKDWAGWTQASFATVGSSLRSALAPNLQFATAAPAEAVPLAGKATRSAGSSLVTGLKAGYEHLTADQLDRERILSVKFAVLEVLAPSLADSSFLVLLLIYEVGFNVWSLKEDPVREIASRREGSIRCLEALPLPNDEDQAACSFLHDWPLLAVVMESQKKGGPASTGERLDGSQIKLYSLQKHSFVRSIDVPGSVLSVSSSSRVLIVAMSSQIMAYNLATMSVSFSVITYPAPLLGSLNVKGSQACRTAVPLALGPRWIAHASNQAVQSASGIAVAQQLANGGKLTSRGSNVEAVQHYAQLAARHGGKQIKSLGEAGYKMLSSQVDNWRSRSSSVPSSPGSTSKPAASVGDPDIVGTVIVRDVVSRSTVVHFRAHTSPLLLLKFDRSGSLLVTASVHGHTINVFHISPPQEQGGAGVAMHLFRLSRGVTPATIQDVSFSCGGHWLSVSSARGTTHVFSLSLGAKHKGVPPQLAAGNLPPKQRKDFQALKITALGRARNSSLLNGSIPGSAAASAALNMYSGTNGTSLLGSCFVPRQGEAAQYFNEVPVDEDLLVASNDGYMITHRLCVASQPTQPGSPPLASDSPDSGQRREQVLTLEPLIQTDICRRHSWPEREDTLNERSNGESVGEEGGDVSQPWAAFAETCIPGRSVLPLWSDSQFHILEMQTSKHQFELQEAADSKAGDGPQAILEVEQVPTKRIVVQERGDMAPVIIEEGQTAVLRGAQHMPTSPASH